MARPFRVEYKNAIYHITSRGNERRELYLDDKDREHFIRRLNEGADNFKVDIISYCLMPNHYHLLIKTREANLSRFMHRLNASYTMYFNFKHKRAGHLFQGRYKAIVVGSDEYFLTLSRYIHLNPVKTKINKQRSISEQREILNNYEWSSYTGILDPRKRADCIKCGIVLDYSGGDTINGRKKYEHYVMSGLGKEIASPFETTKHQLILGSEEFTEWIKETFIEGHDLEPHTHLRGLHVTKDVKEIARIVAEYYGIGVDEILKPRSVYPEARQILVELGYHSSIWRKRLTDLALELGCKGISGVTMMHSRVQERIKNDSSFRNKYNELKERCA